MVGTVVVGGGAAGAAGAVFAIAANADSTETASGGFGLAGAGSICIRNILWLQHYHWQVQAEEAVAVCQLESLIPHPTSVEIPE
jgi:hypothetical protein